MHARRRFLQYLAASPLLAQTGKTPPGLFVASPKDALNVFDFMLAAEKKIPPHHWAYLMTGVDDNRTVAANEHAYQLWQIRARRFVDVTSIDTSVEVFGRRYPTPVMIAPTGSQQAYHPLGELAVARACREREAQMILSTVT
jgi:isopentenyl diphosphate isomerase/L-lactate dehydrogenase-like FMN-dependent dehydrogenase